MDDFKRAIKIYVRAKLNAGITHFNIHINCASLGFPGLLFVAQQQATTLEDKPTGHCASYSTPYSTHFFEFSNQLLAKLKLLWSVISTAHFLYLRHFQTLTISRARTLAAFQPVDAKKQRAVSFSAFAEIIVLLSPWLHYLVNCMADGFGFV